ncbi:hypothetical protein BGX38DRAFT_1196193 [Terfezia claveryi]|nr:hypothetical protein BGX38DRAFT_1196193 [Terfezia claveryi]
MSIKHLICFQTSPLALRQPDYLSLIPPQELYQTTLQSIKLRLQLAKPLQCPATPVSLHSQVLGSSCSSPLQA